MRHLPRLIQAELLKAFTVRSTWGLAIAGLALALANLAVVLLLTAPSLDSAGLALVAAQPGAQAMVLGQASQGALFAMLIGVIASTGEIRHRTWSTTLLITPRRWPVLLAKVKAMALIGILMAVATLLTLEIVGQIVFAGRMAIDASGFGLTLLGTCLAFALYCALGACLGALVRGQVAAIVIVLVSTFALEPLVALIWPDYSTWLPGSAVSVVSALGSVDGASFLPALGALIAWVLVVGFAAATTSLRRDVT